MTSAWLIKTSSRTTTLIGTAAIRTVLPCPLCQVLGLTLYLLYLLSLTSILLQRGYVPSCTWRHWRPEAEHFRNHITQVMARSGQGLRLTPELTFCFSRPVVLNLAWFLTLPPLQGPWGHIWRVFGCQTGMWRREDRNGTEHPAALRTGPRQRVTPPPTSGRAEDARPAVDPAPSRIAFLCTSLFPWKPKSSPK